MVVEVPIEDETGPNRTCIATRIVRPIAELIRFVADPDDVVVPDLRARLPGRGAWVTGTAAAIELAIRRKAFARALKRPVTVPDDLAAMVERMLVDQARQGLALANKAGLVIAGFAKVEAAIMGRSLAALVCARDAAPDGRRKLRQAVMRRHGRPDAVPELAMLTNGEMSLALGREHVIHACLLEGAASTTFVTPGRRLEHFRAGSAESSRPDADDPASTGRFVLDDNPTDGPDGRGTDAE